MYLPIGYHNMREYFHDAMHFLYEYRWVYRYPVTGLLIHDVLSQIPAEWKVVFECMSSADLMMLSAGGVQEHWPFSLVQFLEKCKRLQLRNEIHTQNWKLSQELRRGLSVKKQHEVSRMISLVHQKCEKFGINKVVDVGSGLGYLDFVLHLDLGFHVLGLESNEANIARASQKISTLCANCEAISFHLCDVSSTTFSDIRQAMDKSLSNERFTCSCNKGEDISAKGQKVEPVDSSEVCLIGLHACGDLSSATTDMFLETSRLRLMVLVPCCYHKIATCGEVQRDGSYSNFARFPLSKALTDVLEEKFEGFEEYLGRPFLRLASQESACRWLHWTEKEHQLHSENLMARATLYLAAHILGLNLRKKHRRCVRKTQRSSFETFLEDVLERYDFVTSNGSIVSGEECELILLELRTLWLRYHKLCRLAEAFSGLQAAMQATVESFVLLDKVTYIQEQQSQLSVDIVKVMDEDLSPRCRAIIVQKLK